MTVSFREITHRYFPPGILNVLLTNPLWVVNSRLKMSGVKKDVTEQYRGLLDGLVKIAVQEGVGALWNGTKASLLLVTNPAIKFTFYELLKRHHTTLSGHCQLITHSCSLSIIPCFIVCRVSTPASILSFFTADFLIHGHLPCQDLFV